MTETSMVAKPVGAIVDGVVENVAISVSLPEFGAHRQGPVRRFHPVE
ncbi:MAG: hypothetical protein ABMA15_28405 [Vicinamibacterales bacterium]